MRGGRGVINTAPKPFITTWNTAITYTGSTLDNQIKLPLMSEGLYNFNVDWGDSTSSTITVWNQSETTHTYAASGIYTVTITGFIKGWDWGGGATTVPTTGDMRKLLTIEQWGCLTFVEKISTTNIWSPFYGCTNLTLTSVVDTPNFKGTKSTLSLIRNCPAVTTINNVNKWDVSKIEFFRGTFRENRNFNDNIGNWNTSNATHLASMFQAPSGLSGSFNNGNSDSIKNWNTSNVRDFSGMFFNQNKFNQEVGLWDVSSVTTLYYMFGVNLYSTPSDYGIFNNSGSDSIKNWNTSNVATMSVVFYNQPYFNQEVGTWDTSKVTTMYYTFGIFNAQGTFNNGGSDSIKNWNTSNVADMTQMFYNQPYFDQEIGTWDVGKVTNMNYMLGSNFFSAAVIPGIFNNSGSDSIKNWNTTNVISMNSLFSYQKNFNQPIGSWDTSKVTNIGQMFRVLNVGESAFNQDIGNWDISLVTNASAFMQNKTFNDYSTTNYDALLIGWASRPVKPNISINFGTIKYTAAASASRAVLTSIPNNWTIADGGQI